MFAAAMTAAGLVVLGHVLAWCAIALLQVYRVQFWLCSVLLRTATSQLHFYSLITHCSMPCQGGSGLLSDILCRPSTVKLLRASWHAICL
jgi:hypothetical protein